MYLSAHSYYSLRYGTFSMEELAGKAYEAGHRAMALTDINNSTGALLFVKECQKKGIKPIVGIEFRDEAGRWLYTGIARNNKGFQNLNELLTNFNLYGEKLPQRLLLDDVYAIYPYQSINPEKLKEQEFIGIRPVDLSKIIRDKSLNKYLMFPALTFCGKDGYELHKQLRSIDYNTLISKLAKGQFADWDEQLYTVDTLLKMYEAYPGLVLNAQRILDDCHFEFEFRVNKNKKTFTSSPYDDKLLLEKLAWDGMRYRYGEKNKEAIKRIKNELSIIDKLGFSAYFLITWDIIRYSMSRGFYHVGRGSGANSVVAYCLRITDVCPIELDLYFERFLNPKRKSPPDFDIDYSWKERDEVLDYIFKRYGRKHTALLGAMSTFRDRSVLRELGKVYGLPKAEIDRLIECPDDELNQHEISRKIYGFRTLMEDFPNLRTIHSGGVLISEEPVTAYVALDLPPKGFPTAQFDMYIAEDAGFEKFDILSQRGIGHIKECAEVVARNRGIKLDVHNVSAFKKDEKIAAQIRSGDTIGCFYVESPAMRGLLKKLRCDNYLTLVAASSIIRPGVSSSGMMREYIYRFHNPDKFSYLHPVMEAQLKETYGVMVYQEDVLKVCHHFAGLDLADADVLRRLMSGKGRSQKDLEALKQKFFNNCKSYGYPDELTAEVWRQVFSFGGYSFSKAHSASFAVESYQSLFLKTYYPKEFMVAVINNFGGFYNTKVYINEARKAGANIHLPCVNRSTYKTTIYGSDLFIGFIHIQNLEAKFATLIEEERESNGPFTDLEDFINRTQITLEQLILLVRMDGFRFTGRNKKALLWEAHLLMNRSKVPVTANALFQAEKQEFQLPELSGGALEDAYDEIELLGFPVSMSDFDLLKTSFRGEVMAKDLINHVGKVVKVAGSFVVTKYVRTKYKDIMYFATFLDAEGNFLDTVHFPDAVKKYPFTGMGMYLILGKVVEDFGFPSIEVHKMAKLPIKGDPREG
jgi:error-prone DNA polymerase